MSRRETIALEITGDGRDAERAASRVGRAYRDLGRDVGDVDRRARVSSRGLGSLGGGLSRIAGAASLVAGGLGIAGAAAAKLASAASDSAEATSAAQVTFGKAYGRIASAAASSARTVGLSRTEYLTAAKTLGVMGQSAGLTGGKLATFSQRLVKGAADLASFHNVPVPEALAAIQSGLAGETEPLRKFGIMLNDATLKQEAMRQGLIKTTNQALTPQQKTLAAQALILSKLGPAAGDFSRTSGGLANQQRILSAQVKDAAASLGTQLLPAALKLTTWANQAVPKVTAASQAIGGQLRTASAGAGIATGLLTGRLSATTVGAQQAAGAGNLAAAALRKVGINASAAGQLSTAAAVGARTNAQALSTMGSVARSVSSGAMAGLRSAVSSVRSAINQSPAAMRAFAAGARLAGAAATTMMNGARRLGSVLGGALKGALTGAGYAIAGLIRAANGIASAFYRAAAAVSSAVARIKSAIASAKSAAAGLADSVGLSGPPLVLAGPSGPPRPGIGPPPPGGAMAYASAGAPWWQQTVAALAGVGGGARVAAPTVVHVTVQGALDPVAVAEQIRRILAADVRRTGRPLP